MDNQHNENPVTAQEILDRKARFEAGMPKSQNYSKMILSTAAKQLGMINLKFMNADFQHVIQAKCAIEQVLREWPPATEYQLKQRQRVKREESTDQGQSHEHCRCNYGCQGCAAECRGCGAFYD